MSTDRIQAWTVGIVLAACVCGPAWAGAGGVIEGQGRFERISGRPEMGYKTLYEWNLFVSPARDQTVGASRRLGAPPGQPPRGNGFFRVEGLPAGAYSLLVSQPDFFASPKVVPLVRIAERRTTRLDVDLDVDYATYFREPNQWSDWTGPWYQTFTARGRAVRGVAFMVAGWGRYKGKRADVTVLADNGSKDVRRWKSLATARDGQINSDSDEWVRWPSGQVPLTPGRRYAIKLDVQGGCAVYKRDKDARSYRGGQAHGPDGKPRRFDLNVTVFTDRRGQMVTHTRLASGPGRFDGSLTATRWSQTFVARGRSLAAADLFAASSDKQLALTWTVRKGGPAGAAVGPTKTIRAAYFAASTKLAGVSWSPGQVRLVPGQTYCIQASHPKGFTPFLQPAYNAYADGRAFREGKPTDHDLAMTIMQYSQ